MRSIDFNQYKNVKSKKTFVQNLLNNASMKKYKNCFGDTSVCFKPHKDFYFYANKTDFAERIIKKYIKK